ncbi:MAG: hypothetical protein HY923_09440 [Elusimicrobia bacterium]|nr:hypothetical protein [Elusimicrobiota bacterium]
MLQTVTALAWTNPLTTRIILTTEFGQSPKLIEVWTRLKPLPRITENPPIAMMLGYLLFTLIHVGLFVKLFKALPGRGWQGKGASLGMGIFVFQYCYFEFFGPFNQYHEPLRLISYELLLQGLMAFSEALMISWMLTPRLQRRSPEAA